MEVAANFIKTYFVGCLHNKLIYGYKDQGIQITSYKLEIGEWKNDRLILKYHKAEYPKNGGQTYTIEERPLEAGELEQVMIVVQADVTSNSIFGDGWTNILSNIFNNIQNAWTSNAIFKKETDASAAAYNVRCVKETQTE